MNRPARALLTLSLLAASCAPTAAIPPAPCPTSAASAPPPATAATGSAKAPDAAPGTKAAEALEVPETFDPAAVDAYVARYAQEHSFVGLSLAVLRDGKIVLAKGYGKSALATGAGVTVDTAFAIGSVTKQFTCASVLLLAEDGKLSIDDKVAKYYPNLTRAKDVTLYDLLTHQSGYRDFYPLDFPDREMETPIEHDALIKAYAGRPLDFEPRSRWSYSNTGFILAGNVVEKASGETFDRFLARRILKPLGMDHSTLDPKPGTAGLASGHTSFATGEHRAAPVEGSGWLFTAGGLYATPTDLAKWDLALVDGKVLKPKSLALMTAQRPLADGTPTGYACGIGTSERRGERLIHHSGLVSGFLAANTVIPRTRSAVILLTNSDDVNLGPLQESLVSLLLKDQRAPTAGVPKISGPPAKDVALALLRQLASGAVDRSSFGDDYSRYLTDAKVKEAAALLGPLGEPSKVDVENLGERGAMEVASIQIAFKTTSMRALLYRTPDGRIQQFTLYRR